MRRATLLLVLIGWSCGREETFDEALRRVPEWATVKPGVMCDQRSGLPLRVIHGPTRLQLRLFSAGSYEWPSEDLKSRMASLRFPDQVTILRPFYATDGTYVPPGSRKGGAILLPDGFRFLTRDEAAACLMVYVRTGAKRGFFHDGYYHTAIACDP